MVIKSDYSYPAADRPKMGVGGTVGKPGVIGLELMLSMLMFDPAADLLRPLFAPRPQPPLALCSPSLSYLSLRCISGLVLS